LHRGNDRLSIIRLRNEGTDRLAWSPDSGSLRSLDQVKKPQPVAIGQRSGLEKWKPFGSTLRLRSPVFPPSNQIGN
jgi:hypothetical protein